MYIMNDSIALTGPVPDNRVQACMHMVTRTLSAISEMGVNTDPFKADFKLERQYLSLHVSPSVSRRDNVRSSCLKF